MAVCISRWFLPTGFIVAVMLAVWPLNAASAETYQVGDIKIETPWTRATPGGATMGGGYARITNTGNAPDRLIAGSADVAGRIEIHEMGMADGVMRMREIDGGLEIPPGETVLLEPGGFHIMFIGLESPLTKGGEIAVTLEFDVAGSIEVMMPIAAIGAKTPGGAAGHDGHSDHGHAGHDHSGHDHSDHGTTN